MVGLRFADMRFRPTEFLDFTSLTVEEFQILIPPFEAFSRQIPPCHVWTAPRMQEEK
jgi:hypothetical protein